MVTRRDVVRLALALPLLGFASAARAQQHGRCYVIGFVKNPGAYHLKPDMKVGDALDAAGGFDPKYHVTAIEIHRVVDGQKETLVVSLTDDVLDNDTVSVK